MTKKTTQQAKTDATLALRSDANGIAKILGLTVARIQQMRREGGLKPDGDGLYSVVDALRAHYLYDSPRGDALRARTRHTNVKSLECELAVRRAMRRLVTMDELRDFGNEVFERATDSTQAESSRFFHEFRKTHTEQESLVMTGRLYNPLIQIAHGWSNGLSALIREIEEDRLPDAARLGDVLAKITAEIAAANAADQKKLATPS
jgi:hypothetical protein